VFVFCHSEGVNPKEKHFWYSRCRSWGSKGEACLKLSGWSVSVPGALPGLYLSFRVFMTFGRDTVT
jgi:hypothetical protein